MNRYIPRRGDVVWLEFDPRGGHEQAGIRPALVLSPVEYNRRTGLILACPITTKVKGYPFEVAFPPGSAVEGIVLSDQVKNLDWRARRASFKCRAPENAVEETLAKLNALLR